MTAKRVVILAAAAVFVILVVSGIYYFFPPGGSTTVTIVATGGSRGEGSVVFAPRNFTVMEGERVTLILVNRDTSPHELVIPALDVNINAVYGGASASVSFTPEKTGTFSFFQPCGTSLPTAPPSPSCYGTEGNVTILSP
jgi:uncharacterized cupredoxin-like copper-binding protein